MVVVEGEGFFDARRRCGSFDARGVLFDFIARVQIIIALPGFFRVPPRFGISAVRAKIKNLAERFGCLPYRAGKFRLIDQNTAGAVLQQGIFHGIGVFIPAAMTKLDNLRVIVKSPERVLQLF